MITLQQKADRERRYEARRRAAGYLRTTLILGPAARAKVRELCAQHRCNATDLFVGLLFGNVAAKPIKGDT